MAEYRNTMKLEEFFRATKKGKMATVKSLLYTRAVNPNARNFNGSTALHYAIIYKQDEAMRVLLQQGASVVLTDTTGNTPLSLAALANREKVACELLAYLPKAKVSEPINSETLLHIAVNNKLELLIEKLLNAGAEVNFHDGYGQTPLHWAAWHGHTDIVGLLLKCKGIRVNDLGLQGTTPIHAASASGHLEVVKKLGSYRANLGFERVEEHTEFLLAHYRADLDSTSQDGFSPIMLACRNGHSGIVAYLVSQGAAVNRRNGEGLSCIHIAVSKGYKDVLEELLKAPTLKVNLPEQSSRGLRRCPLHLAVMSGSADIMQLLLNHPRLRVDSVDRAGDRALHLAVRTKSDRLVNMLMKHGARLDVKNLNGETPLDLAFTMDPNEGVRRALEADVQSSGCGSSHTATTVTTAPSSPSESSLEESLRESSREEGVQREITPINGSGWSVGKLQKCADDEGYHTDHIHSRARRFSV